MSLLLTLTAVALLSDAQAQRIVAGCAAHAAPKGQSHAIAVVDPGGQLLAVRRMDGNSYGMTDFAIAKARAAAAWGGPTSGLAKGAREVPGFSDAPHVVIVPGGLPIFDSNGARVGAAGASGEAPSDDEACVRVGITAAGLFSERPRPVGGR